MGEAAVVFRATKYKNLPFDKCKGSNSLRSNQQRRDTNIISHSKTLTNFDKFWYAQIPITYLSIRNICIHRIFYGIEIHDWGL